MSVLAFREVTRRFGDVVALNRVTLDLEPGITALVGPNGAGKSTLMKVATGHVKPTLGTVRAFDQTVWDNPDVTRRLGFVPEQDAFYEFMTGHQFVAALATLHGFSEKEASDRAHAELDRLGLDDARHRPIKEYSKGMRQRVKLAQALVHEPSLLFLDEPLLGCDPIARRRIQDRVRQMADDGCTVLLSTHILPEVERLTRRIAIVAGGRLVARGDAHQVRDALSQIPSRVRIHAGQPRKVAAALALWDNVLAVQLRGEAVDVETTQLKGFLEGVQSRIPADWDFRGLETLDADIDSLFSYLAGDGQ